MRELNLVPLSALRAVEAVARLGGLRPAADELGVSEGAVSQAVIKAEARLERTLFERHPKGMRPTELGTEVCATLTRGMGEIVVAVRTARRESGDLLTVSVAPVFASRWLVSRLGRFHDSHPNVKLRIDASLGYVDLGASDVDVCIRSGHGPWEGTVSRKLAGQSIFPVCSPALAARMKGPASLADAPILRDASDPHLWSWWMKGTGADDVDQPDGTTFSDAGLCMDAAIAGQGVYLALDTLVQEPLRTGALVRLFPEEVRIDRAYWLVARRNPSNERAVRAFGDWLDRELGNK